MTIEELSAAKDGVDNLIKIRKYIQYLTPLPPVLERGHVTIQIGESHIGRIKVGGESLRKFLEVEAQRLDTDLRETFGIQTEPPQQIQEDNLS